MPLPLEKVLEYQPSRSVYERFLHSFPMTQVEAELIFTDCVRYLWLTAKANEEREKGENTPDIFITEGMRIIDEMWHCFILYTEFYEKFCRKYLSQFIHHPPLLYKYYINKPIMDAGESNELLTNELIEYVYENLGEEVAIRWFDTYLTKYDYDHMMH